MEVESKWLSFSDSCEWGLAFQKLQMMRQMSTKILFYSLMIEISSEIRIITMNLLVIAKNLSHKKSEKRCPTPT